MDSINSPKPHQTWKLLEQHNITHLWIYVY